MSKARSLTENAQLEDCTGLHHSFRTIRAKVAGYIDDCNSSAPVVGKLAILTLIRLH